MFPYLLQFIYYFLMVFPCVIFLDYHKRKNIHKAITYVVVFYLTVNYLMPFLINRYGLLLMPLVPVVIAVPLIFKAVAGSQKG